MTAAHPTTRKSGPARKAPHKPGRGFWIRTWLSDLLSPGTGAHRINDRLQQLYENGLDAEQRNCALIQEVQFLRLKLGIAESEKNMLITQDAINEALPPEHPLVNQKLPTSTS